jgi:hypothetical protein
VSIAGDGGSLNSDLSVQINELRTVEKASETVGGVAGKPWKPSATVAGRTKPVTKNTGVWTTSMTVKKAAPMARAAQATVRYNTTTIVRSAATAKKCQPKEVFQAFTKARPAPRPTNVTVRYNTNATAKLAATRKALATAAVQTATVVCAKAKSTATKEVKTPPRRPQWK